MAYPHEILIEKANLKIEDLSPDLQTVIKDFDERVKLSKEKQTEDETVDVLTASSNVIAQTVYDYYVPEEEQETEIPVDANPETIIQAAEEIVEVEEEKKKAEEEAAIQAQKEKEQQEEEQRKKAEEEATAQSTEIAPAPITEEPVEAPTDPVQTAIEAGSAPVTEPVIETPKQEENIILPTDKEELGLYNLFKAGKKENLSKEDLKAAGVKTGFFSELSASQETNYGNYKLVPIRGTDKFNLIKK